jgi:acetyl esterase
MNELATGLRRRAGALIIDNFFRGLASAGKLHPKARPSRHGVEVIPDVAYRSTGRSEHLLDVYRPIDASGPLPVVLYVHGGGFRILSKDTHWLMGLQFARSGYVVFNVNYRLAPEHPFPAALEDVCDALAWVSEHARAYGGDPERLVFAGESAGANLVTSLAIATSWERPEPYARLAWETGLRASAVVPACGMLQVTRPERLFAKRKLSPFLQDRINEVSRAYVGAHEASGADVELADPLLILEQGAPPDRPLAPMFAPVGTKDPLLDDTRRLKRAMDELGTPCEVRYYEGEVHAFHAAIWRPNAQRCWTDTFTFLDRHVPR